MQRCIQTNSMSKRTVHLSLHSFTPELKGRIRDADVGILYDPRCLGEMQFALKLQRNLKKQAHLRVRRNYPYKGCSDGMTRYLRTKFPQSKYIGIEIELNQVFLSSNRASGVAEMLVWAINESVTIES